jgi:hypothetical protein
LQLEYTEGSPDELHGKMFRQQRMEPAWREPEDFEVKIVGLPAKHEIPHTAADQPGATAGSANQLLNAAQRPRKRGILNAEANRQL